MRMRLAGSIIAAGLLAASARATLEPGAVAPGFEPKEFVNTEPVTLKALRGHVILYEVFRTW